MRVGENSDFQALNMSRLTTRHTNNANANVAKLASGSRINTGADDPAGVVVAAKLRGRASGADAAAQNAQNAATWAKTADNAYSQALDILYREREIVTQATDGTNALGGDTAGIGKELEVLDQRLTDLATSTKFGDQAVWSAFRGLFGTDATQDTDAIDSGAITLTAPGSSGLTADDLTDPEDAQGAIATIDGLIESVAKAQGEAGGFVNAFGYIADGLAAESSNMWDAHTSFTETNTAKEMTNYVKNSILTQQAQLINAQYNQNAYSVLNLLK